MDANAAALQEIINRSVAGLKQAQAAAKVEQKEPVVNKSRPVVLVRNGTSYLDTYNSGSARNISTNPVLRQNRFVPLIQPRTQIVTTRKQPILLSNSTTQGQSGGFTSMPVQSSMTVTRRNI